LIFCS